jgi:hypothetical protein
MFGKSVHAQTRTKPAEFNANLRHAIKNDDKMALGRTFRAGFCRLGREPTRSSLMIGRRGGQPSGAAESARLCRNRTIPTPLLTPYLP